MNTQNYIPSRNDILSLATESFESLNQINNSIFESEMYGGRNKPSPGDEFHQAAIEYLKTDLKLPEIEARAYKSIAYRKIKEMNPEANHLERAKLMLEMVKSKNFVKENKDKLAEIVKILKNLDAEKTNKNNETENNTARRSSGLRKSSRKSSKKRSRKGSRKSQRGGGNLSETSVDVNYTESNANVPYYNEYRAMKTQYLQAKQNKLTGGNLSETSVDVNFTESNANVPYYNEYRAMKTQYLQAKNKQMGGGFSETSVDVNYTESKANVPYYNEYRAMKTQYLQAKNKQMGGGRIFNFNSVESLQNFLQDNQNVKLSATIMLQ
jgi:ribosomal protein L10